MVALPVCMYIYTHTGGPQVHVENIEYGGLACVYVSLDNCDPLLAVHCGRITSLVCVEWGKRTQGRSNKKKKRVGSWRKKKTSAFYSKDFFLITFQIFLSRKSTKKGRMKKKKLYLEERKKSGKENFFLRESYVHVPSDDGFINVCVFLLFFFFSNFLCIFFPRCSVLLFPFHDVGELKNICVQ